MADCSLWDHSSIEQCVHPALGQCSGSRSTSYHRLHSEWKQAAMSVLLVVYTSRKDGRFRTKTGISQQVATCGRSTLGLNASRSG